MKQDSNNQWQEDVCYVGVVAWNKLAESCRSRLQKGSAVLIEGELQSRTFRTDDERNRTIVEIKAKRIQFLNKVHRDSGNDNDAKDEDDIVEKISIDENSFDKFLTDEESNLIKE